MPMVQKIQEIIVYATRNTTIPCINGLNKRYTMGSSPVASILRRMA